MLPNLHPLVVHFPVALLVTAALVDLASLLRRRPGFLEPLVDVLYTIGAVAAVTAYLTGRAAAADVHTPGMAYAVMQAHWNWALATSCYYAGVVILRLFLVRYAPDRSRGRRVALAAAGLIGIALLVQTADRGGRLVYQYGVGVAAAGPD